MPEGAVPNLRRLPFVFQTSGGVGRLVLEHLPVGPFVVERLELEVAELGTDPGLTAPERFQRRRTRLRALAVRIPTSALDDRLGQVRKQLAALGITQLSARFNDGFVSVRARAADGLTAADLSFRIQLVHAGTHLRALASMIRVHGHMPSPGPVIADRILSALLGATDTAGIVERPRSRGLCDAEIDLINGLLWHLMPPAGWRLPAVADIELVAIKIGRSSVDIAYGPPGTRGELGVRPQVHQLAAAQDLMHSVDAQLRDGHLEDAMRGYRALLASGGPDQPLLLERILGLASARPAWFFDGLELARQALGRWPHFPPAHAALASISLAQGDAREAAAHLSQLAQLASADGDDDQAALAALAGARLLRVLEPKAATQLYQLALEHDPGSAEAADSLADRLADEQRWPELVRLVRARAVSTADPVRAVALRLRLADVFVHQLGDPASAQQELAAARLLAPEDPAVHEMTATILGTIDPPKAIEAWREVARLAETRGDHRTSARAWAILGDLQARPGDSADAELAWRRAIELDPLQAEALGGLANAASARADHAAAAELLERMRGLGLPQHTAARFELMLARSYLALSRTDDARSSLRRATVGGGETAAEAHAVLAEIAEATFDREHAAAELDTAISSFVDLAIDDLGDGDRLYTRAAQLAVARAGLFDRSGQYALASEDYSRAHTLAHQHAPELARDAAKTMLSRAGDDAGTERRWIDAVLATRPPPEERAALLVRRAEVRRKERTPDLAAALADLHEALQLIEDSTEPEAVTIRRAAYQLEANLLAQSGDQRARAQALAALANMAERAADRIETETAAAAAWLAADEPAAALPHGARALVSLTASRDMHDGPEIPATLRREVLVTLGEAAWRQRAWPDVIRAYRGLLEDPGSEAPRIGTFRYRLAVAADRTSDPQLAIATLAPLVHDTDNDATRATSPEMRGQALRLFADLAERAGDLGGAATALESFAALGVESSLTARADAMYRAGELFRRAGREEDCVRCLEAALRISDTHLPALDALEAAWRERGDLERVSVILGRKVAATARHPTRQKPLLSRLGDLQDQLGRPDVALATHQRALEIDPAWRPSLRYVTVRLRDAGQVVAAAGGLAQLAGELPNDQGVDLAIVARERQIAAVALAELVTAVDGAQLDAIRVVAKPALERASVDAPVRSKAAPAPDHSDTSSLAIAASALEALAGALARLRGEAIPTPGDHAEEDTQSGRKQAATTGALSLRAAADRSRAAGKLDEAFATLEAANHVSPGDLELLRELVELATLLEDHEAAATHLTALAARSAGTRRGDTLLELADLFYDQLDDPQRGRTAMREAAEAFGSGKRRDTTLRMLASEAASNLAWDIAVESLSSIALARRTAADIRGLALALARAGRDDDAIAALEDPVMAAKFEDGGELLAYLRSERDRKAALDDHDDQIEEPTHPRRVLSSVPQEPSAPGDEPTLVFERTPPSRAPAPEPPPPPRRTATIPPESVIRLPAWARPPTTPPPTGPATRPAEPSSRPTPPPTSAARPPAQPPANAPDKTMIGPTPTSRPPATPTPIGGSASSESPASTPTTTSTGASTLNKTMIGPASAPTAAAAGSPDKTQIRGSASSESAAASPASTPTTTSTGASAPNKTMIGSASTESAAASRAKTPTGQPTTSTGTSAPNKTMIGSTSAESAAASRAKTPTGQPATTSIDPSALNKTMIGSASAPTAASATADKATANTSASTESAAASRANTPTGQPTTSTGALPNNGSTSAESAAASRAKTPTGQPTTTSTGTSAPNKTMMGSASAESAASSRAKTPTGQPGPTTTSTNPSTLNKTMIGSATAAASESAAASRAKTPTGQPATTSTDPSALNKTMIGSASAPTAASATADKTTAKTGSASAESPAASRDQTPAGRPPTTPPAISADLDAAKPPTEPATPHTTLVGRVPHAPNVIGRSDQPPPTTPPPARSGTDRTPIGRPKSPSEPTDRPPDAPASRTTTNKHLIGRSPTPKTPTPPPRTPTLMGVGRERVPGATGEQAIAKIKLVTLSPAPTALPSDAEGRDSRVHEASHTTSGPSVVIKGTASETAVAVAAAAASADRERLFAARREHPEDASVLLALLAHLGDREPKLRHDVLEQTARDGKGRALAIALHELALLAREAGATTRASSLWSRAYEADPSYELVWMHVADVLVTEDDLSGARELYEKVAASEEYEPARRAFAAERAEALGRDASIVSGEITPPSQAALARALRLADSEDWQPAIVEAERAVELDPSGTAALLLLERLYLEVGDVTSASEAIGRQLMSVEEPAQRAILWRRRARLYRDTLGRDAEAYRCLKEAHACAPADPEIAYQLRTAAMVRGEWALAASLLYREIAAAANPRDRGALHLELALVYEERLDDDAQAQVNYEQALAFDPTIPAAKLPLARRYETIGRHAEAARLYEEAAGPARPADRGALLEAAARAHAAAAAPVDKPDLPAQLERNVAAGDHDAALAIAHQVWRAEPGHAGAFRVLAAAHRGASDLPALTELTSVRASQADSTEDRAAIWLDVARLAEAQGALDQAARAYDLALIEDPGHVGALDARGALAFRLADYATADLIYRDLGSGDSVLGADELALRRSIISEQLGRDTEALAHARAAAAAAPSRRDLVMRVQDLATRTHDLDTAIAAARSVLDLIPLDDEDAQLATHFALVELQRQAGNMESAIIQLERVLRDHPMHAPALEALAELQMARADWPAATRYLYQLVPLAPSPIERAERLFRLGETVLVHLGDTDRADDVFLRASDLDPAHVPTLRRLLDVYWRADDPAALVEVATELAQKDALASRPATGAGHGISLAHAMIAAALVGETTLAKQIAVALGDEGPRRIADALAELSGRDGRLQLASASTAIAELGRRGFLDLSKVRAAAAGTPVAAVLG